MEQLLLERLAIWRARGYENIIDLVFAIPYLANAVVECRIAPELQYGSDHLLVYTEIDV